jgi:HK97 gp10 family phage protein
MTPTWKLEGAKDLEAGLMELEGVTAKRIVSKSLQEALEPVATSAKAKVPVWSGILQRSIGIGARLTKRQRQLRTPIAPVEAYVGPGIANKGGRRAVAHAHLVEFGTVHMPPHPYMRPAWQGAIQAVWKRLVSLMSANLERAAARAAKKAKASKYAR